MNHLKVKRLAKEFLEGIEGTPPELTEEEKKAEEEKRRIADEHFKAQRAKAEYDASPIGQVAKLRQEAAEKLAKAERTQKLIEKFPDIKRYVGRWDKEAYYSKTANAQVTRFDLRHNCGCCSDSPLEVWPYTETELGKVYSDPPEFRIGERHWMSGDKPYPGWKDKLKEAGIPEDIIGVISMHFKKDSEERKLLAEESDEDEDE